MMKKGFTLIELLTAVSIFSVVMVISMGSILGIFDANRKSRALKIVMGNLNLAVESMSKEMRFGQNYHCGGGDLALPANCPSGGDILSFLDSTGTRITYRLENSVVTKEVGGSGQGIAITAPEVIVDSLTFYTLGAGTGDTLQPKVLMKIKVHAGSNKGRTNLTLQTLVSQRLPDI